MDSVYGAWQTSLNFWDHPEKNRPWHPWLDLALLYILFVPRALVQAGYLIIISQSQAIMYLLVTNMPARCRDRVKKTNSNSHHYHRRHEICCSWSVGVGESWQRVGMEGDEAKKSACTSSQSFSSRQSCLMHDDGPKLLHSANCTYPVCCILFGTFQRKWDENYYCATIIANDKHWRPL